MPPEPLTRGLPPPDPRSLCPQLNLLNPPKRNPGYATGHMVWSVFDSSPFHVRFVVNEVHWGRFSSQYLGLPPSLLFHQRSQLTLLSILSLQKDKREKPCSLQTKHCSLSDIGANLHTEVVSHSCTTPTHTHTHTHT